MSSVLFIKIISALLYPLGLVAVLALLCLVCSVRRRVFAAKLFATAAVVILLLSSSPKVARHLVYELERQYPQRAIESIEQHDAIVVLGGGLRIPLPPAQHVQLAQSSDRYWYAARLYKAGKARKIILSGGNVYQQSGLQGEAHYAAELLRQWGVPADAIIVESMSRTTSENQGYTLKLLRTEGFASVLLITSAIHMPRAYYIFGDLPILVTPASADVIIRQHSSPVIFSYIPAASALNLTTMALHEIYGSWFEKLKRRILTF